MADTPTIAPALTAEEWRAPTINFRPGKPEPGNNSYGYGVELTKGRPNYAKSDWMTVYDGSWAVTLTQDVRHKLAALSLHGQPFGFTREDVVFLRRVAEEEYTATGARLLPDGERLLVLASRIEALLPPETTPNG